MKPIKELLLHKKELGTISVTPSLGSRPNGECFKRNLENIKNNTFAYREGIFSFDDIDYQHFPIYSLGGGDPMANKSYTGLNNKVKKLLSSTKLSHYNYTAGNKSHRKVVLEYLNKIGISTITEEDGSRAPIGEDNIIFTSSTSHGFSLVLSVLLRPYDVVLFTGPTYGLFAYYPERVGGITKLVELKKEDGFVINPNSLAARIDEINSELKAKYADKLSYQPRVVAFLNENPHNPMGTVLSIKDKEKLYAVATVCESRGVFIIDDLIYRDLGYDRKNLALPIASESKYFNSTISLFGLSKAYGLAGLRAGIVVGNKMIIAAIRDLIFQNMDSLSLVQSEAIAYCFNSYNSTKYTRYFKKVIDHYLVNLEIVKYLVYGSENDKEMNFTKKKAKQALKRTLKKEYFNFINNNLGLKFAGDCLPDSGFFAILDFSSLKGKQCKGITINNEDDLLYYAFKYAHVKFITGQSMGWPNKDELIARITFSMKKEDLIHRLNLLRKALNNLN